MHHFFNEKKPRRDLVEFPRRGRTFSPWLKKVESTTRHFLRVETEKKRRRIEEAKNQAKNSARMQINPESGKFTPLFVYHRRINYSSFSPCRLRHPIFSISRFACYSSSFRIKSYQWSMWLWFYSIPSPLFSPLNRFVVRIFDENSRNRLPLIYSSMRRSNLPKNYRLESIPPMKIPVLYGQKGQRRRSFRLANYPWQSMNVKRIIRDRVYTEPPCFLP